MKEMIIYAVPVFGVLALLFTIWKSSWVTKQEVGTEKMANIAKYISDGAMSFLKAEYKVLALNKSNVNILFLFLIFYFPSLFFIE